MFGHIVHNRFSLLIVTELKFFDSKPDFSAHGKTSLRAFYGECFWRSLLCLVEELRCEP